MAARSFAPPGTPWVNQVANCFILPAVSPMRVGARQIPGGFSFVQQHLEIGANHPVTVLVRGPLVASGGGVLSNLAEDPRVGRRGAANHHRVAAG